MAIAFIVLLVLVPPFVAWHFAGYFDGPDGSPSRYARWSEEDRTRKESRS